MGVANPTDHKVAPTPRKGGQHDTADTTRDAGVRRHDRRTRGSGAKGSGEREVE